jgi:hypothetical protein
VRFTQRQNSGRSTEKARQQKARLRCDDVAREQIRSRWPGAKTPTMRGIRVIGARSSFMTQQQA